jgi:hypothetical protein
MVSRMRAEVLRKKTRFNWRTGSTREFEKTNMPDEERRDMRVDHDVLKGWINYNEDTRSDL